jgi:hypothetical protein
LLFVLAFYNITVAKQQAARDQNSNHILRHLHDLTKKETKYTTELCDEPEVGNAVQNITVRVYRN